MSEKSFPKLLFVISLLCTGNHCKAQLDTVFWFAAPEVSQSFGNFDRPIVFRISALGQAATVTLSMPANPAFIPITTKVPANGMSTIDVTAWIEIVESKPPNTILNNGLKISSTAPVNIYYEVISGLNASCQCNPEIFVLKGKNGLGKDFFIPSQNVLQNGTAYSPPATNSFDIVASEDNTNVTITPKAPITGHTAGIPFTVTLNKGQVFSCTATGPFTFNHLTGSQVSSDKPVAISVKDDLLQGPACWDLGGDQVIPTNNLSTAYIAIKGYLTTLNDLVFVSAINNGTKVSIGGVPYTTLNAGQTIAIPFGNNDALYLESNEKVYVFQLSGFGCEAGLSTIPSTICRGSQTVSFARSSDTDLILLITTRSGNESAFQLNGLPLSGVQFNFVPGTSNQWVYARTTITVSQIPALGSGILTNGKGVFHLGIIHGSTVSGGSRFGYFSDFASPALDVLQDTLKTCNNNVVLNAGPGYSSYNWNTGSNTSEITVTKTGLYGIEVTSKEGCVLFDSGFVKIDNTAKTDSANVLLCSGESYKLPWGVDVSAPGTYRDTLRFASGCDSIRRIVKVQTVSMTERDFSASICSGESYLLPWGISVNQAGTYSDTLRSVTGCDSVVTKISVSTQSPLYTAADTSICAGDFYVLPSGRLINQSGLYHDTLKNVNGCDSLISVVTLHVNTALRKDKTDYFCASSDYLLPWGTHVDNPGTYKDTLRNRNGCDSIISSITLLERSVQINSTTNIICTGESFPLPWGGIAFSNGIYSDTARYSLGCDSLIRIVRLSVISPAFDSVTEYLCPGQAVKLPSGKIINSPGTYMDTVKTYGMACDSLITKLIAFPGIAPTVQIAKSNDISCSSAYSRLSASGGAKYFWYPSYGLNNVNIGNPIASPATSTVYHVKVTTADGCTKEDSIAVNVTNKLNGNFLMPTAFTPNNDGINDCFGVKHLSQLENLEFSIYNRWGQLIFYTKNPMKCWDGTYKSHPLKSDVFVYQVKANTSCGRIYKKGTVVLIR